MTAQGRFAPAGAAEGGAAITIARLESAAAAAIERSLRGLLPQPAELRLSETTEVVLGTAEGGDAGPDVHEPR